MSFILYLPRDQATPAPALWLSDLKAILYWGFSLQAFQATRQRELTRRTFPRLGEFWSYEPGISVPGATRPGRRLNSSLDRIMTGDIAFQVLNFVG
jgi:hypothetical protein